LQVKYLLTLFLTVFALAAKAVNDGHDVVVVFNSSMPESKDVAEHYAKMRDVPTNQIIGFNLPQTESMSRQQFNLDLENPLAQFLERQKLFAVQGTNVTSSTVRYIVLCYGVPLTIENDPKLREKSGLDLKPELRKNGAAVDSELATLPSARRQLPLAGPLSN